MLQAIPFQTHDLKVQFVSLRDVLHLNTIPIYEYIDKTCVRGVQPRGKRRASPPLFTPELWNVFHDTL